MNVAEIEVELAQETTDALVNPPVELIAVTNGRTVDDEAKFVPAIVTDVAVVGGIIKFGDVIVGLVSPTVTEPPNATAEPLIVILELDNLPFDIEPANLSSDIEPASLALVILGILSKLSVPEVIELAAIEAAENVP